MLIWGGGSRTMRKSAKRKTRSHTPSFFIVAIVFLQDFAVKAGITVVIIYDEPLW